MIREILTFPLVYILSRMVGFVGLIGRVLNPVPLFVWFFDVVVGFKEAEKLRDHHAEALVDAVEARELEYGTSKQVLIEKTQNSHQESLARISRGESILSIGIAIIAVFIEELPGSISLLSISLPIPALETLLLSDDIARQFRVLTRNVHSSPLLQLFLRI